MFNEEHGTIGDDLPFDFSHHRTMPYRLGPTSTGDDKKQLGKKLESALLQIIQDQPKRPSEERDVPRAKIEHDRDVATIRRFMRQIHWPTIDAYIEEMPYVLNDRAIFFWEGIRGVYVNSLFHLFDRKLSDGVDKFVRGFSRTLDYDFEYHETPNPNRHIFSSPGDAPLDSERQKN